MTKPLSARIAAGLLALLAVAGCRTMPYGEAFEESFWAGSPLSHNTEAELGLAELAKGNYVAAETRFDKALAADADDLDALMGAAILYQGTGREAQARRMYERILALRPAQSRQFVEWTDTSIRPLADIAAANLALLDRDGPGRSLADGVGGVGLGAGDTRLAAAPAGGVAPPAVAETGTKDPPPPLSGRQANVVGRFVILGELLNQELITGDEYARRRATNLGALLPLTAGPPAAGLDRPTPAARDIVGRLRAIGRALEMGAIGVGQHAEERAMILEALMPAKPPARALPPPPPADEAEAADAVRRLAALREAGLIRADESAREEAAIANAVAREAPVAPAEAAPGPQPPAAAAGATEPARPAAETGAASAVHLASYRSRDQALRGWAELLRTHEGLLSGLEPQVARVDLGAGKGVYFRLMAGPVASREAALDLCRRFRETRQYCEPTAFPTG